MPGEPAPRADHIGAVEGTLAIAVGILVKEREACARDDPNGRHLSLAITHIEDALFRLREVR